MDQSRLWPPNIQCAVALTFDFDAQSVWLADDPANANRPVALSQGRYGSRVAVPLILKLLQEMELPATFFTPGEVAEEDRKTVRAIAESGHELAVHGFTHVSPTELSATEEEDALVRARDVLQTFGAEVVGYRSPSWELSPNTMGLLEKLDFTYASNMMDELRPYRHPNSRVIELPVQWLLDDAVHFWFDADTWNKKIATPSEVREIWEGEFEGIYELGGAFVLTLHPQIIGRPHRLKLLRDFITFMDSHSGVWFATCAGIVEQARSTLA